MTKTIHLANSRGAADYGWLQTHYTFSFADYHNPERMHFGKLRVLNDDTIAPAQGFSTHSHHDMEIVTIPLSGALAHKDNAGHEAVIHHGEVQLMSAGTGIEHSEYNDSADEVVSLLQIWVFPASKHTLPRYDQQAFEKSGRSNQWQTIVSPLDSDAAGVKINQQAYFSLTDLAAGQQIDYQAHQTDAGVYLFVIDGVVEIADETLHRRDAIGLSEQPNITMAATQDAQLLLIEVPL